MQRSTKTIAAAFGLTSLLVAGVEGTSYAATGHAMLLGHSNVAGHTTTLTNSGPGAVLSLHSSRASRPPLKVDSSALVKHLNAGRVSGYTGSELRNNVRVFNVSSGSFTAGYHSFALGHFPKGSYLASYAVYMEGAYGSSTTPVSASCYLADGSGSNYAGYTSDTSTGTEIGVSATDVVNNNGGTWALDCSSGKAWNVYSGLPIRVTLTKIDDKILGGVTASAKPAKGLKVSH